LSLWCRKRVCGPSWVVCMRHMHRRNLVSEWHSSRDPRESESPVGMPLIGILDHFTLVVVGESASTLLMKVRA
jgi:hypothetical protein